MPARRLKDSFGHAPGHGLKRGRRRDIAAALVERADALPDPDRALILAIYAQGRSVMDVTRDDTTSPGTLVVRAACTRRRVRALARRLLDPTFELVRMRSELWPPVMGRVGRACILEGLSMRQASQRLGVSVHTVRTHVHAIRALSLAEPLGLSPRGAAA